MNEKYLRVLEFPKIRERMAALATTDMGRDRARALNPSSDPALVAPASGGDGGGRHGAGLQRRQSDGAL